MDTPTHDRFCKDHEKEPIPKKRLPVLTPDPPEHKNSSFTRTKGTVFFEKSGPHDEGVMRSDRASAPIVRIERMPV